MTVSVRVRQVSTDLRKFNVEMYRSNLPAHDRWPLTTGVAQGRYQFLMIPLLPCHDAMHVSPESKKTIAFMQANSESSTCTSLNGRTTSSNILFAIRLMSDSCATLGITQSLPSNSTSLSGSERRASPSRRCSPACARSSATYETNVSVNLFERSILCIRWHAVWNIILFMVS